MQSRSHHSVPHYFLVVLLSMILTACWSGGGPQNKLSFMTDFPSANIGKVTQSSSEPLTWDFELQTDNNDETLPDSHRYRNWWYVKAVNVPTDRPVTLQIKNRGFFYYYLPVYSYDNKTWRFFDRNEISQPEDQPPSCDSDDGDGAEKRSRCYLRIRKTFKEPNVWLARFYPYTVEQVDNLRRRIEKSPYVETIRAGVSAQKRPIWLFKIGSKSPNARTIWVHARTHPHETGAAFAAEGLIDFLLSETPAARQLRSEFTFYIAPLHNPDGVAVGNYRLTPQSINLETEWKFDWRNPGGPLLDTAPIENKALHQYMKQLIDRQNAPMLALNLHSSNEPYDTPLYLIPHFSSDDPDPARRHLWQKQVNFVCALRAAYDKPIFLFPLDTQFDGAGFLNTFYPETWWWANAQDKVNAITIETVYGNGGTDRQLTDDDLRNLGKAIGMSLLDKEKFADNQDPVAIGCDPQSMILKRPDNG